MIDFNKFQKSLLQLQRQFNNYQHLAGRTELTNLDKEAVVESVIQRFETCYDCLWKLLKRYLIEECGVAEVPNSPKPIFRLANENQLLAAPIESWLLYADARVATTHDYSGEKAQQSLLLMPDFIHNATDLYQRMQVKK